jgi:hypothetical protein
VTVHGSVCTPTGRRHWDITTVKKNADTSQDLSKSSQKYHNSWLMPLHRWRPEWYTNTLCPPQIDSRSCIKFVKHMVDLVQCRTGTRSFQWRIQSDTGPKRVKTAFPLISNIEYVITQISKANYITIKTLTRLWAEIRTRDFQNNY